MKISRGKQRCGSYEVIYSVQERESMESELEGDVGMDKWERLRGMVIDEGSMGEERLRRR